MSKTLAPSVQQALGNVDSEQEAILNNRLRWLGVPPFETQVELIPERKLRYDVVFGEPYKVIVELQGGVRYKTKDLAKSGAHTRGLGFEADCIKSALAQIAGYLVIAVTPGQVRTGVAGMLVMRALESRGWVNNHVPGVRGQ